MANTIREVLEEHIGNYVDTPQEYQDAVDQALAEISRLIDEAKPDDSPHHDMVKTEGYYSGVLDFLANLDKIKG